MFLLVFRNQVGSLAGDMLDQGLYWNIVYGSDGMDHPSQQLTLQRANLVYSSLTLHVRRALLCFLLRPRSTIAIVVVHKLMAKGSVIFHAKARTSTTVSRLNKNTMVDLLQFEVARALRELRYKSSLVD